MNQTDPEALDLCVHIVRFGFWDNLRWTGRKKKITKNKEKCIQCMFAFNRLCEYRLGDSFAEVGFQLKEPIVWRLNVEVQRGEEVALTPTLIQ